MPRSEASRPPRNPAPILPGLADALRILAAFVPRAQIHGVERARHWLQLERAALGNERLADFIG